MYRLYRKYDHKLGKMCRLFLYTSYSFFVQFIVIYLCTFLFGYNTAVNFFAKLDPSNHNEILV